MSKYVIRILRMSGGDRGYLYYLAHHKEWSNEHIEILDPSKALKFDTKAEAAFYIQMLRAELPSWHDEKFIDVIKESGHVR